MGCVKKKIEEKDMLSLIELHSAPSMTEWYENYRGFWNKIEEDKKKVKK